MDNPRILFLQLPLPDNDTGGPGENLPLAGIQLAHALRQSEDGRGYIPCFLPPAADHDNNAAILQRIENLRPDVVACTLYLWNVERTLHLLRALRRRIPGVLRIGGGPEVAPDHPFLLRSPVFDALVCGEGEYALPVVLQALRSGESPDRQAIAWRAGTGLRFGTRPLPRVELAGVTPPPEVQGRWLRRRPAAYIETTRGCPLRCTYCRYHQLYHRISALPVPDILARIRRFRELGARELRFVDPMLNAHPQFDALIEGMRDINRDGGLACFAEIRADNLRPEQARDLAAAGFREIEVGLQCITPEVLRAVRRPARLDALAENIRTMRDAGILVTLDLMYGLPLQTEAMFLESLEWCRRLGGVRIQAMRTLLLPGTELRATHARYGIPAVSKPPYAVTATAAMPRRTMRRIERCIAESPDLPADYTTPRFTGCRLPGLFPGIIRTTPEGIPDLQLPACSRSRRAVAVSGTHLFRSASSIASLITRAVREDPDSLWQFILEPGTEEPLDLLEALVAVLRRLPASVNDRFTAAHLHRMASRRLFIRLRRGVRYDRSWKSACEDYLSSVFL
jgi:radical SAM superfamily enzyme YgiQ (UPF0313 family)